MIVTVDASILVRAIKRSGGPARKVIDALAANDDYVRSVSRLVEPAGGLPVVLSDPHDDAVLYTAVAAGRAVGFVARLAAPVTSPGIPPLKISVADSVKAHEIATVATSPFSGAFTFEPILPPDMTGSTGPFHQGQV